MHIEYLRPVPLPRRNTEKPDPLGAANVLSTLFYFSCMRANLNIQFIAQCFSRQRLYMQMVVTPWMPGLELCCSFVQNRKAFRAYNLCFVPSNKNKSFFKTTETKMTFEHLLQQSGLKNIICFVPLYLFILSLKKINSCLIPQHILSTVYIGEGRISKL